MEAGERTALELKKLALEISDLERRWWKRPAYVLAALPTMLAFGTLLVGAFSGYFQAAYIKLENQKHDLEAQVKDFEARRDDLHQQYETAKKKLDEIIESGEMKGTEAAFCADQLSKCRRELEALKLKRQK